jgi:hypothetical protein
MKPVNPLPSCVRSILKLSFHLDLCLQSCLFSSYPSSRSCITSFKIRSFTVRSYQPLAQPQSWSTTPCRLPQLLVHHISRYPPYLDAVSCIRNAVVTGTHAHVVVQCRLVLGVQYVLSADIPDGVLNSDKTGNVRVK